MPDTPEPAPPETILAFDFGLRRIGVAVGQTVTASASPLGIIHNGPAGIDTSRVDLLIREWHPARLVVGMPVRADVAESGIHAPVLAFIDELARFGLPVEIVDERYTSREAEAGLRNARKAGRRRRVSKEAVDCAAAVLIAERYLAGGAASV